MSNTEARKVLLAQAAALKMDVDGRWSTDTLAEKVLEAQSNAIDAERAAFEKAKKIPVLLKRDAFPLQEEKHLAGETIEVPLDMARYWIENGVAVRADPLPDA